MAPTAAAEYDEFTESSIVRNIPLDRLVPSTTNPRKHVKVVAAEQAAKEKAAMSAPAPAKKKSTPKAKASKKR